MLNYTLNIRGPQFLNLFIQVQEEKQVKKSDNSFTKEEIIKRLLGNK